MYANGTLRYHYRYGPSYPQNTADETIDPARSNSRALFNILRKFGEAALSLRIYKGSANDWETENWLEKLWGHF